MSTPIHVREAVEESVRLALKDPAAAGKAMLVCDYTSTGQHTPHLNVLLMSREQAFADIEKLGAPADAVADFRKTPAHCVPVIFHVREHMGAFAYELPT